MTSWVILIPIFNFFPNVFPPLVNKDHICPCHRVVIKDYIIMERQLECKQFYIKSVLAALSSLSAF